MQGKNALAEHQVAFEKLGQIKDQDVIDFEKADPPTALPGRCEIMALFIYICGKKQVKEKKSITIKMFFNKYLKDG